DYGAEIIKIEPTRGGRSQLGGDSKRDDYFFLSSNRSKKSIAIDLKKPEGLAALKRLLPKADVVIDNFRPGVMDKMGIGFEQLSSTYPRIICCSISGFGSS